jgi:glutathione peroxidase
MPVQIGLLCCPMTKQDSAIDKTLYDFTLTGINGKSMPLEKFKGHPVLLVNTASECSFTPQYEGLEKLWETYRDKGLVVVGVPSDDFGGQEPGQAAEIVQFCKINYGVTFPLAGKTVVSGEAADPLYLWAGEKSGQEGKPTWNFHKYLFDAEGKFVDWFASETEPESEKIISDIDKLLTK